MAFFDFVQNYNPQRYITNVMKGMPDSLKPDFLKQQEKELDELRQQLTMLQSEEDLAGKRYSKDYNNTDYLEEFNIAQKNVELKQEEIKLKENAIQEEIDYYREKIYNKDSANEWLRSRGEEQEAQFAEQQEEDEEQNEHNREVFKANYRHFANILQANEHLDVNKEGLSDYDEDKSDDLKENTRGLFTQLMQMKGQGDLAEQLFEEVWNDSTDKEKVVNALGVLLNATVDKEYRDQYYQIADQLDEELQIDVLTKILATNFKYDKNYRSLAQLNQETFEKNFDEGEISGGIKKFWNNTAEDWLEDKFNAGFLGNLQYITGSFEALLSGDFSKETMGNLELLRQKSDLVNNPFGPLGNMALGLVAGVGKTAGNVLGGVIKWASNLGGEQSLAREYGGKGLDEYLATKENEYVSDIAEPIYQEFLKFDEDKRAELLADFTDLSKGVSNYYKKEAGTSLDCGTLALTEDEYQQYINEGLSSKEIDERGRLKLYAQYLARLRMFNKDIDNPNWLPDDKDVNYANTALANYWQNTVATLQSPLDKMYNTAGQFVTTAGADILSLLAIITTPAFMSGKNVDTHGSDDPDDWTIEGTSYTEALVEKNPLMKAANSIQEASTFDSTKWDYYKDLGLSANQIYRTVSEEESVFTANDIYDCIGQYGFTFATMAASCGGSSAVKAIVTRAAKKGLMNDVKFIRNSIHEARAAEKAALAAGNVEAATQAGKTITTLYESLQSAKEYWAKMAQSGLYRGNLGVTASLGTAEGGLEAYSTYDRFIEENEQQVDELMNAYQQLIDNADEESLIEYLRSTGITPEEAHAVNLGGEDGIKMQTGYSKEQLDFAKAALGQRLLEERDELMLKVRDNALDAAAVNLLANSAINGAIMVTLKSTLLSRDARAASRTLTGKDKLLKNIKFTKNDQGKILAETIKAKARKEGQSLWSYAKENPKEFLKMLKGSGINTLKTASGEFLEEWGQNLSDQASRAMMQYDIDEYFKTAFDENARDAYAKSIEGMINAGISALEDNALSKDAIKEGIMGFLTGALGGVNFISLFLNWKSKEEYKDENGKMGFKGWMKYLGNKATSIWQSGAKEGFREEQAEMKAAQKLAESINAVLNTEENASILDCIANIAKLKEREHQALLTGDLFDAKNDRLGSSVESIFLLELLKDTDVGKQYLQLIKALEEICNSVAEDLNIDELFNDEGRYTGNDDTVKHAIRQFRGDGKHREMTDRDIVERTVKQANGFFELRDKVLEASNRINWIFGKQEINLDTKKALIHAQMRQQDAIERLSQMSDEDREIFAKTIWDRDAKNFDEDTVNFIIKYGTAGDALAAAKKMEGRLTEIENELTNGSKKSNEKKTLKAEQRQLKKDLKELQRQIQDFSSQHLAREENEEDKEVKWLDNADMYALTAWDIAQLDTIQRAALLRNYKDRFKEGTKQRQEIETFLKTAANAYKDVDALATTEDMYKRYLDEASLSAKADIYNDQLNDLIMNPRFVTELANQYRVADRKRALRYKYRNELQLKDKGDGTKEDMYEAADRLLKLYKSLKDNKEDTDAAILKGLMQKIPALKPYYEMFSKLDEASMRSALALITSSSDEQQRLKKAFLIPLSSNALKVLAEAKRIGSFKELIDFVRNDINNNSGKGIIEVLKTYKRPGSNNLALGGYLVGEDVDLLEKYFKTRTIEGLSDNAWNEIVQEMWDILHMTDEARKPSARTNAPRATSQPAPSRKPDNQNKGQNAGQNTLQNANEPATFTVITPGDFKNFDKKLSQVVEEFFHRWGVTDNLRDIKQDNNIPPTVSFLVCRMGDGTYRIAAAVQKDITNASEEQIAKYVKIPGNTRNGQKDIYFAIIGLIDDSTSPAFRLKIEKAQLNNVPSFVVCTNEENSGRLEASFTKIGDTRNTNDIELENPQQLNLNETDALNTATDLLKHKTYSFKGDDGTTHYFMVDDNDRFVMMLQESDGRYTSIIKMLPEEDLARFDKDLQISDEELKKLIESIPYLKTWFNLIKDKKFGTDVSDFVEYTIRNFVYLGKDDEHIGKITIRNGQILIPIKQNKRQNTIKIDMSSYKANAAIGETIALDIIRQVLLYAKLNPAAYSNPQLALANNSVYSNKTNFDKKLPLRVNEERLKLTALLTMGWLYGYEQKGENLVMRHLIINNPFAKGKPQAKTNQDSDTNPKPKNVAVKGGTVNPETENPESGKPKGKRAEAKDTITRRRKLLSRLTDLIQQIKATDDTHDRKVYTKEGDSQNTEYQRVTSMLEAIVGNQQAPFKESDASRRGSARGTTVDNILRALTDAFNRDTNLLNKCLGYINPQTLNPSLLKQELKKIILADPAFKDYKAVPHISDDALLLLFPFIQFYAWAKQSGWTITPKDITLFGSIPVRGKDGRVSVAGTLDLLAITDEGRLAIIDIKTIGANEGLLEKNMPKWTLQVSTYAELLKQTVAVFKDQLIREGFTESEINEVLSRDDLVEGYILPIQDKTGDTNKKSAALSKDGMQILTDKEENGGKEVLFSISQLQFPKVKADLKKSKDEFLVDVTLQHIEYDASVLDSLYSEVKVDEQLGTTEQPIAPEEAPKEELTETPATEEQPEAEEQSESEEEAPEENIDFSLDDLEAAFNNSEKTQEQSSLLSFIHEKLNSLKVTLNFFNKVATSIKMAFRSKKSRLAIYKSELANIFFGGSVTRLNVALGNVKVSSQNTPAVIEALRKYYESNLKRSAVNLTRLTLRHAAAKHLLRFVNDEITEEQLNELLAKDNIKSDLLVDYIDYIRSEDKEKTKELLKQKIEATGLADDAAYERKALALRDTEKDMRTKYAFLNNKQAEILLANRLSTIEEAVTSGTAELLQSNNKAESATISKILLRKEGTYQIHQLLSEIAKSTKNAQYKALAKALLNELNKSGKNVTVTINKESLNTIEGRTINKDINIYSDSLSSQARFERVLLHEAIHAIVEVTPELKRNINKLIKQTIDKLSDETGKTSEEIINEYYGLKNAEEFISEFFTNVIFQETLNNLFSDKEGNIFDNVLDVIKDSLSDNPIKYDNVAKALYDLLPVNNTKENKMVKQKPRGPSNTFKGLDKYTQKQIKKFGLTEDEYDELPTFVLKYLEKCC